MEKVTAIGLDLAKTSFQVHGVDSRGHRVLRKNLRRSQVAEFFAQLPSCVVGMEACGSAHYWARKLTSMGHEVRLIAPQFVKPYVKTHKTDAADAEAICEAVERPNMRFVPIKTPDQQAILSVHRVREGYVKARTALANQIRGLLTEYGIIFQKGIWSLTKSHQILEQADDLPGIFKQLIEMQLRHLQEIEERILETEHQIQRWHRDNEASQRLMAIPGVGILTATAMTASVGDAKQFKNSHQMAAWLGLVPRQHSTGGKPTLLGISKRGDVYLRKLMIHGARSVLCAAQNRSGAEKSWHMQVMRRRNHNVAAVALAHKNARTIWAILSKESKYDQTHRLPAAA